MTAYRHDPASPRAAVHGETTRSAAPPRLPAQELLGIPVGVVDYRQVLDWVDDVVAADGREYVCVAAVHTVMACEEDPDLREAVLGAGVVLPDGMPLVWALNRLGHDMGDRVYGPELMDRACARAARTGQALYLYGGHDQGALVQLTLNLRTRHPGLRVVGGHSPPHREPTAAELDLVVEEINASGADVVWVGIGVPKQEKWMAAMRERLDAPVLIGVGAAFDFHSGRIPQAPYWMQRAGLEWSYRLAHEPGRLWRRYARYNPRFVASFARQWTREHGDARDG